ncbi:MAG: hypothetical protein ACKKL6_02495 [Candidatus Komeilibacteria bacterium]
MRNEQGMIALISILVISSVVLMITISLSWYSTAELQMSWWSNQSEVAYELAVSCMEEGLNDLRLDWSNTSKELSIDGDSCIINVVIAVDNATVVSTATVGDVTRSITAIVDQSLEFISWEEN